MRSFVIACVLAAVAPFLSMASRPVQDPATFPGWPRSFDGEALVRLPSVDGDAQFTDRLEGRMARFRAGDRELVLRWTWRVGTGLHSGRYCYRGLGYDVVPEPAWQDSQGHLWSSFSAVRGEERRLIRERVYDARGQSWPEVSEWFWDACRGRTDGPWWSVVVEEPPH